MLPSVALHATCCTVHKRISGAPDCKSYLFVRLLFWCLCVNVNRPELEFMCILWKQDSLSNRFIDLTEWPCYCKKKKWRDHKKQMKRDSTLLWNRYVGIYTQHLFLYHTCKLVLFLYAVILENVEKMILYIPLLVSIVSNADCCANASANPGPVSSEK